MPCSLVFLQEMSSWEIDKVFCFYLLEQLLDHGINCCACRSLSLKCSEYKKSQWMTTSKDFLLSFLPPLSSWPQYSCSGLAQSPQLSTLAATRSLLQTTAFTKYCMGYKASGVSLTLWPTSMSTRLQTKTDSIIHPSQANKNVNKEQKLPVLHISEGLFSSRALLKLILLQAWPRPFLSIPFSKATVQSSAP